MIESRLGDQISSGALEEIATGNPVQRLFKALETGRAASRVSTSLDVMMGKGEPVFAGISACGAGFFKFRSIAHGSLGLRVGCISVAF
jgi:hypothetical protein